MRELTSFCSFEFITILKPSVQWFRVLETSLQIVINSKKEKEREKNFEVESVRYPKWLLRYKAPLAVKLLEGNTINIAHDLKIWPQHFQAIRAGDKTYEIRRNHDRKFHVGDVLKLSEFVLAEYDPYRADNPGSYTGRHELVLITYVGSDSYSSLAAPHTCVAMSIVKLGLNELRSYGVEYNIHPLPRPINASM